MKTTVRSLAALSILLISSMALVGQKSLLIQSEEPPMASTSATTDRNELSTEFYAHSHQFSIEERIQLESWMVNAEEWVGGGGISSAIRLERESEMEMENWMVKPFKSKDVVLSELIRVDREDPLKLQKWMYCCADWGIVSM